MSAASMGLASVRLNGGGFLWFFLGGVIDGGVALVSHADRVLPE
jgi:hypothetical protein